MSRMVVSTALALVLLGAAAWAQIGGDEKKDDPYAIVDDQAKLEALRPEVEGWLAGTFGFKFNKPIDLFLVEGSEMDARLRDNPYKGAETGLYVPGRNGRHQIYLMKEMSRDECSIVLSHEMTHAWQNENCPRGQSNVLKEGMAVWVEYKFADHIGAYQRKQNIEDRTDPVYGLGFKLMLAWEDKLGQKGLLDLVRHIKDPEEGPK